MRSLLESLMGKMVYKKLHGKPAIKQTDGEEQGVFKRLALHLDRLPAGYPPTESGVELRILKRLFTPEEAEIAAGLTLMSETAEAIAKRLKRPVDELAPKIEEMSRKGLIYRTKKDGKMRYMAAQFVIGIWEYHVNDLDPGLIADVNEYMPELMQKVWLKTETKQLRVIPVSQSLSAEMTIMAYDQAEEIIRRQSRIVVATCICRKETEMVGKGCHHPKEVCLIFGSGAHYYEENGLGKRVAVEEALGVLKEGLDAGLVLQPGNAQKPANICLCCGCCCQVLKNLKSYDKPALAVNSSYYAAVDADNCSACELCIRRCHMDAITMDDTAVVNHDRCIGCGLCVIACEFDALTMRQKPEDQRANPPTSLSKTYLKIAKERGLL